MRTKILPVVAMISGLSGVLELRAQGEPGWWVVNTMQTSTILSPGPMPLTYDFIGCELGSVAADESGSFFLVRAGGVTQLQSPPNVSWQVPWQQVVLTLLPANTGTRLAVDRRRVWMLGSDGYLKYVLKDIPNQVPTTVVNVAALGIVAPPPPFPWWTPPFPILQCTNGRELFVTINNGGAEPAHIFAIDVESNPIRARALLQWPTNSSWPAATLRPGRDGKLLMMKHPALYELDPEAGGLTTLPYSPAPYFHQPAQTDPFEPLFDYDAWEDRICTGTHNYTLVYTNLLHNGPGWGLAFFNLFEILHGVTSLAPEPFELFGIGCPNGTGRDPRLGWQGLPLQGGSFSTKLRDAEPNGVAFLWLGLSDTFWAAVGALPFDAAPFGAPGCMVRVSADVIFPVPVDANGRAAVSHAVPLNPALAGWEIYAQSASSSTANALGLSASDALVIRLR